MVTTFVATTAALLIGFLGGLLTFKRSGRWCVNCGHTLRCPHGHEQHPRVRP